MMTPGPATATILSLDVPCDPYAPASVRAALTELDAADIPLHDAVLVASELVTNAVLHSGCGDEHMLQVRARRLRDRLLISVHDPGISGESALLMKDSEFGLWGLRIIERLVQRWGCERPDGYRVWAELPMRT